VDKLTRNVSKDHLLEIFGKYGKIKSAEVLWDKRANLPRGAAFVDFLERGDAEKAVEYLDGSQIDGNVIVVVFTDPKRNFSPRRRFSPGRRGRGGPRGRGFGGGYGGGYGRRPSPFRGGRGPIRRRSRSPLPFRRRSPRRSRSPRKSRSPRRSFSRSRSRSPDRKRAYSPKRSRSPAPKKNRGRSRSFSRSRSRSRS